MVKVPKKYLKLAKVSNFGRVRSQCGVVTYGSKSPSGYTRSNLYGIGHFQVHNLVLYFFKAGREKGQISGDHINRVKSDNRLINLRWASPAEQIQNQSRPSKLHTAKTANEAFEIEGEVWKPVEGGTGYMVSSLGRWRTKRNPERSFTPIVTGEDGRIRMWVDGKWMIISRAVGYAFARRMDSGVGD